jgi:hypothetical protein
MGSTRCTTDNGVMSTRWAIKSLWATKSSGDSTYIFRKLRSRRQTYNQRCFKTKVLNLIYDVAKSVTWQVWGAPSLPWAMLAPHQLARAISHDRKFCFQNSLVVRLSTDPEDSKNIGEIFVRVFLTKLASGRVLRPCPPFSESRS